MGVLEENIRRVNNKLQQLLKMLHLLQKENVELNLQVEELQGSNEKGRERIIQLEQQVAILKSAAGPMPDPDKKAFEKQINQYIREIDKCIALLSE